MIIWLFYLNFKVCLLLKFYVRQWVLIRDAALDGISVTTSAFNLPVFDY